MAEFTVMQLYLTPEEAKRIGPWFKELNCKLVSVIEPKPKLESDDSKNLAKNCLPS